jgi:chromosome partitioning protein
VLIGTAKVYDALRHTDLAELDLLPANRDLAGAEVELVDQSDRESRLSSQLAPVRGGYDFIIIDCPPSLGMLTLNALCAADAVLVPLQCEYYALEGLSALLGTLERVRAAYNPSLRLQGILLTMFDARTTLSRQVAEEVRSHFAGAVFDSLSQEVRLGESPSHGLPATYDPASKGAEAYRLVARELLNSIRDARSAANDNSQEQDREETRTR